MSELPAPRRGLRLRTLLLVSALLGVVYVLAITVFVSREVASASEGVEGGAEAVTLAMERTLVRFSQLDAVSRRLRAVLASAAPAVDSVAPIVAALAAVPEPERIGLAATAPGITVAMRAALASAADLESELEAALVATASALRVGDIEGARTTLSRADATSHTLHASLADAQIQGIRAIDERALELVRRTRVIQSAVGWWLLFGTLILVAATVYGRHRLFAPIEALDGGLARLSAGESGVRIPARWDDEVGELTSHFNSVVAHLDRVQSESARERTSLRRRLSEIFDEAFDEIYVAHAETLELLQASRGAREATGIGDAPGVGLLDVVGDGGEALVRPVLERLATGAEPSALLRLPLRGADGRSRPADVRIQYSALDAPPVFVAIARDRTEVETREDQLERNSARLARAQQIGRMGSWEVDLDADVVVWSEEMLRVLGADPSDRRSPREIFQERVHPDDLEFVTRAYRRAVADRTELDVEHRVVRRDGEVRVVRERGEPRLAGDAVVGYAGTAQDVTELRTAERALRESLKRLHNAREAERGDIARDLHDELGSALTGLKMGLTRLDMLDDADPSRRRELASRLLHEVDSLIAFGRQLATRLRPGVLEELGIVAAIDWLAQDFRERTAGQCDLEVLGDEPGLPDEIAVQVFRICQEALTNVGRHARAKQVHIRLVFEPAVGVLEVSDDGVGFDAGSASSEADGLGLVGARERAQIIDGSLDVVSRQGGGTRLTLRFPVPDRAPVEASPPPETLGAIG